jgi:Mrp family chromosome partitioning ATPase
MENMQNLAFESLNQINNCRSLSFVASHQGDGASTAAIATAKSLSENLVGNVLLVDGNMDMPSLSSYLELPLSPGFSDLLNDPAMPMDELIHKSDEGFDVITSGEKIDKGLFKMTSDSFKEILKNMKEAYDYVLFDLSPVNEFPMINNVMKQFDGVILVIACESTRWDVVQNMKEKLESSNANIVGFILNKRKYYIPKWLYSFV